MLSLFAMDMASELMKQRKAKGCERILWLFLPSEAFAPTIHKLIRQE